MKADDSGTAAIDSTGPEGIGRCRCGRLAMARCWLGEHSPARWLLSCHPTETRGFGGGPDDQARQAA